jgi:hypothetical protein
MLTAIEYERLLMHACTSGEDLLLVCGLVQVMARRFPISRLHVRRNVLPCFCRIVIITNPSPSSLPFWITIRRELTLSFNAIRDSIPSELFRLTNLRFA